MSNIERWIEQVSTYWTGKAAMVQHELGFTMDKCESCGSGGGERYHVEWFYMDEPADSGTDAVCLDCAVWLCNGDTPDVV